ncbi:MULTISPECIES: mechanosensitive ion channel domain-containing protein [Ectothiorhodospira]|nr:MULTISPECIES: mechanosensitive ion channel domain-containing protein [Ectothiorhodospira]MCG5493290.1 mechanosensitive ion channel [Ectothiorhodospira variabilis]MCG5496634.1 mechanosensitive ion channel [Ectothiorhodospira variabilis]MCG5502619.1 mechanosensitive ion channel [Ectothiorhodospira variabilis]MCG5505615.1 mechanosensitive ion channel [Ectothiorhodospira variabilis]MCG5523349.1 mechanosensitive ion channel [Ectothiorhodospira haloalkaliphila]
MPALADSPSGDSRLADILEDDQARAALIAELRRSAAEADAVQPEETEPAVSLPGRVAQLTQSLAEGTVEEVEAALQSGREAWQQLMTADLMDLTLQVGLLAGLIAATLVTLWLLSWLARFAYRGLNGYAFSRTGTVGIIRRGVAIISSLIIDVATVLLAWLTGYAIALFVLGTSGEMTAQETLFLNAFLIVELLRAAIRLVFSKRWPGLRPVPLTDEEAAYWTAWTTRMAAFLGYGLLFVVPVVNQTVTPELGRAVALIIIFMAFLKGVALVMQNRKRVKDRLITLAERMETGFAQISLNLVAKTWHVIALVYLAAILGTAVLFPEQALPFMLAATFQTLIAVAAGIGLSAFLTRVILRRIQLPEDTRTKFPQLEERLNAYIPMSLKITRFTILAIVAGVILDAWTPFSLAGWVASDSGTLIIGKIVAVALIIAFAMLLWLVIASWIEFKLNPAAGDGEPNPRTRTLLTIFRNAIAIALIVMTVMVVLAEIGINIGPLIAGAGVLGLAIGFGAQKLVQDVITGVFIQLENAVNVGDVVTAGGMTGTVERLTIRSMGLRDLSGTYHLMPFSSVDAVSNYMRDFGYHVGEYGVAYREDTDQVIARLRDAFAELRSMPEVAPNVLGDLEVHGVTALADSSVNVRVRIKTAPGMQWAVGREYNRLVKRHFDAAGIEIPFPHMTLYFGEDKAGQAPPARILLEEDGTDHEDATAPPRISRFRSRSNPKFKGDFDEGEE